jgi:hypothetical protein
MLSGKVHSISLDWKIIVCLGASFFDLIVLVLDAGNVGIAIFRLRWNANP